MNGKTFLAYVERQLEPAIMLGDVVVMDHLPTHKVAGMRQAIETVGVRVVPRVSVTTSLPSILYYGSNENSGSHRRPDACYSSTQNEGLVSRSISVIALRSATDRCEKPASLRPARISLRRFDTYAFIEGGSPSKAGE